MTPTVIALGLIAFLLLGIFGALNRIAKALAEMGKMQAASMTEEAAVKVLERSPGTDIVHWMETIMTPAIARDHHKRSPTCYAGKMDYVKIPFDEASGVVGVKPKVPPHA